MSVIDRERRRSHLLAWMLAFLPGLLALPFLAPGDFSGAAARLNLLGRLAGIWGLSLMLVAAMLCCRVPGFDRPFGGLTKLWQLHHRLGAIGFMLILAHPVLLAFAAADVSLAAAVATLFTPSAASLWGWVALVALILFMAPSFGFFGEPEYQHWKWLHRLSGVTVVFALIHTLLLNRTLPGAWGVLIWGLLTALTLVALTWRWIFSRWHGRHPYLVINVERPANNVVELTLKPQNTLLRYEPGQFVYLTPHDTQLTNGVNEEHPYTLSSAPDEPNLRIAIKALGDASHALQTIRSDTLVSIEGPYGRFFPGPDAGPEPELWIAGGIGVTPFLARLRQCVRQDTRLCAKLIYCVQDEARQLYEQELARLIKSLPNSSLHLHHFYRQGPLDVAFIETHCPDFAQRTAYICGPTPLITLAEQLLRQGGLPASRIVTEEFVLL